MASIRQTQQQKQLQKLSPQQIQLMKLLQVPTAELEDRIKSEIEENPALDYGADEDRDEFSEEEDYQEEDLPTEKEDELDLSEYIGTDDDIPDYRLRGERYSANEEEERTIPIRVERSFKDSLERQLSMLRLTDEERRIAKQVIGNLDEAGYLHRSAEDIADELAFSENMMVEPGMITEMIKKVQGFDPPGIAASNLQECLLIQIRRKDLEEPDIKNACDILNKQFEAFTKKHYNKITKSLDLTEEELRRAIEEITKLNPRPGGNYGGAKTENYVIPDFFVKNNNGELELTLNGRNAPELHITGTYKEMLKAYDANPNKNKSDKEAVLFIKQKIDSAKWFIDAIKQRQNTLLSTMETIMRYQEDFFLTHDETTMKPMILKDIADRTGLDISTISRVANSKYVQTEFGILSLKYFFSESLTTSSGEEVSTREVKRILQDIVAAENKKKPLSDEKLTNALKEKGYKIARRTVAKYREQLNIPVARLRKEL